MTLEIRILLLQGLTVTLIALGILIGGGGSVAAGSMLAGGGCAVLPNAWLALRLQRLPPPDPLTPDTGALMVGVIMKLGFTAALLALALTQMRPLSHAAFFGGFVGAIAVHHAGALLLRTATHGPESQKAGIRPRPERG